MVDSADLVGLDSGLTMATVGAGVPDSVSDWGTDLVMASVTVAWDITADMVWATMV